MTRKVRDYVQVGAYASLDQFIEQLSAIRDSLPTEAEARVHMRGDDYYGRHFAIAFNRPLTSAEAEVEGRYARKDARLKAAA
jgi:hypothetical protein